MAAPPIDIALQNLWAKQPADIGPPQLPDVVRRAAQLHRQVLLRNLLDYGAALIVTLTFAYFALTTQASMLRAGSLFAIAGAIYMALQVRKAAARRPSDNAVAASSVAFHRAELARQRDWLRRGWRWYAAPFAPAILVFFVADFMGRHDGRWAASTAGSLLVLVLLTLAAAVRTHLRARNLQRELDTLDAVAN